MIVEDPVAELPDGEAADRLEGLDIVRVDDQPRDLVLVVVDERLLQEAAQRHVGEAHLCGHMLFHRLGSNAGQLVSRPDRCGLGHERLQVRKRIRGLFYGDSIHRRYED